VYYHCVVDGDRWSLAAWDVHTRRSRILVDMPPGGYILGAQVTPGGLHVVANVWDGTAFVAWVIETPTGHRVREIRSTGAIYDASFTGDGRVIYLGVVDGRFQIFIDGVKVSDAPYAVLAPRETHGTIRFLDREGWNWNVDEIPTPSTSPVAEAVAVTPVVAPPSAVPIVGSDEPYSPWEHLLFPQLRSPTLVAVSSGVPHVGAVLGGGDRLGMQRWSIAGYAQAGGTLSNKTHYGADAAYLNTMLAPWSIIATAGFIDWVDPVTTDDPDVTLVEDRRTRDASLSIARTWRGSLTTTLSGLYTDDFDHPPDLDAVRRHLGGPALEVDFASTESTPYVAPRRALGAYVRGAYYPHDLSTFTGDIYDIGGAIAAVVPVPLGRRHTISVDLRGRALVARDDTGLLQLGGDSGLGELYTHRSIAAEPPDFDDVRFPPNLRFIELLRGYEDYAITTDRVAIADISWTYPLIVDRGVAATLWRLPASFIRELDLELFADGAIDRAHARHAAGGAALSLRFQLLRVPLVLQYQIARRIRDDDALVQLIGLGPDL
jgi:hypothetical protein